MKIAALLLCAVVAGAFAQAAKSMGPGLFECEGNEFTCGLKKLGHHVKYHTNKLGENLKEVGTAILNSALDQGKVLLTNAAQALLGTALEHLNKEGLVGKREVAFFEKVRGHVANGMALMKEAKQALHAAFEKAVNNLTGMIGNMTTLKSIEGDADKEIDGVVEEFNNEGKKGFAALSTAIIGKLQAVFKEGMAQIKAKLGKKVERRAGFDSFNDAWETARGHLSNAGGAIANTFQSHIDSLKNTVSDLADHAKQHGSNLADAAVNSFNDLKDQLNKHVDALRGHASTLGDHANSAIDALKEAVTSIAMKTLSDITNTPGDAVQTGQDTISDIGDHVNGALVGSY